MSDAYTIHPIARIHTDFSDKFGIPRQSGLVPELTARIVFEPDYRDPNALVGLDGYSHLWLIWQFSTVAEEYAAGKKWRPTVRPPRLGGNVRRGVFATRSPYRPNALGLSCVELAGIEGCDLLVKGADLLDGTPIYDIKPYLPYVDAHPRRPGRVHGPDRRLRPGRGVRRGPFGQSAKGKAGGPAGCAEKRPPAGVSARPRAGLHAGFWGEQGAVHGGRTNADGTGDSLIFAAREILHKVTFFGLL